ncbi:MAG: HAD-IA family hydrolase [Muribaculaceae bacterium]|nr:HAD-IA family hydrolase [Muribaculaceae bacterium]
MNLQEAITGYLRFTGHKSLEITTALIDMDGVLYDSMKNHTRAWYKLMTKNGIKATRDEFYAYEGMTGTETLKMLFRQRAGKILTNDEAVALYKVKTRYFHELGEPNVIEGVRDVLQILKEHGVARMLVTGSGQQSVLERVDRDFPELFAQERITAADVSHGKPNPEPYLKGMSKMGAKPNQCMVIENAPLGVQAGHAAGCFTIGITTGPIPQKDLLKAGADLVFPSMEDFAKELPDVLSVIGFKK